METTIYTTIVYWGNIGIMENEMETTIGFKVVGKETPTAVGARMTHADLGFRV